MADSARNHARRHRHTRRVRRPYIIPDDAHIIYDDEIQQFMLDTFNTKSVKKNKTAKAVQNALIDYEMNGFNINTFDINTINDILLNIKRDDMEKQIPIIVDMFPIECFKKYFTKYGVPDTGFGLINDADIYMLYYLNTLGLIDIVKPDAVLRRIMTMTQISNLMIEEFMERHGLSFDYLQGFAQNYIDSRAKKWIQLRSPLIAEYLRNNTNYDGNKVLTNLSNIHFRTNERNETMVSLISILLSKGYYTNSINNLSIFVKYGLKVEKKTVTTVSFYTKMECAVCFTEMENQLVFRGIGLNCKHAVCSECLMHYSQFLKKELETNRMNLKIRAPCCDEDMQPNMMADIANVFGVKINKKALCHFVVRSRAMKHPLFTDCPNEKCNGYAFVNVDEEKIERCHFCKRTQTFRGRNFDASFLNENNHLLELNNYARCPKCQRMIEKNGGCPNMHCTFCNHSFQWKHMHSH